MPSLLRPRKNVVAEVVNTSSCTFLHVVVYMRTEIKERERERERQERGGGGEKDVLQQGRRKQIFVGPADQNLRNMTSCQIIVLTFYGRGWSSRYYN